MLGWWPYSPVAKYRPSGEYVRQVTDLRESFSKWDCFSRYGLRNTMVHLRTKENGTSHSMLQFDYKYYAT
jgi:hypothetical protein